MVASFDLLAVDEDRQLLLEDLGGKGHGVVRLDRTVGPHLEHQTVVVGPLAHAGVGHPVVHLLDGREQAVDRNDADRHPFVLVLVRGLVAASHLDGHLHLEVAALGQGRDVLAGIEDRDAGRGLNVGRGDFAFALLVDDERTRSGVVHPKAKRLDVEDDVRDVLDDTLDGGELVQRTVDLDGRYGRPLKRAEEHATKAVAQRDSVATLERLARELPVAIRQRIRVRIEGLGTNKVAPVPCNGVGVLHAEPPTGGD